MTIELDLLGEAKVKLKEPAQISMWNTKLGVVSSFSLPILKTCPGKTEFCSRLCYGLKGRFAHKKLRDIFQNNLKASWQADFAEGMVRQLLKTKPDAFRLHVLGDFYSVKYIEKWIEIAGKLPYVKFFGSTRSWRVPELRDAVERFRDLPNTYLRASVDFSHFDRPSDSWGVWSIEGKGDPCPHDYGLVKNCTACKKCWQNKASDIRLKLKWGNLTQLSPSMI